MPRYFDDLCSPSPDHSKPGLPRECSSHEGDSGVSTGVSRVLHRYVCVVHLPLHVTALEKISSVQCDVGHIIHFVKRRGCV